MNEKYGENRAAAAAAALARRTWREAQKTADSKNWIRVDSSLPKDGDVVLVANGMISVAGFFFLEAQSAHDSEEITEHGGDGPIPTFIVSCLVCADKNATPHDHFLVPGPRGYPTEWANIPE